MSLVENKQRIEDAFTAWAGGDGGAFFRLLAPDVRWTVIGHTPISGTYITRQEFMEGAARPLGERLESALEPKLLEVIAEGDAVVVRWEGRALSKRGVPYNQSYCWVMRIAEGRVQEGTAYLDTQLVSEIW